MSELVSTADSPAVSAPEGPREAAGAGGPGERLALPVPARALRRAAALALGLLFAVTAVAQIVDGLPEADWAFGIIAITSLDYRGNIANWCLASLLAACAVQLALLGALRRRAAPGAGALCGLLAALALAASLVGFVDFAERLDAWLPAAQGLDGLLFWSSMLALPALLPFLLGESHRAPAWTCLAAVAGAAFLAVLLFEGEATLRQALRLWYDSGGSEGRSHVVAELLTLCGMMARLALAATAALVLLDKLAGAAAGLRIDAGSES